MENTSSNPYSNLKENNSSLGRRLWLYQKERFPLAAHGIMISAFSFSAISYSRICRGAEGFVPASTYLVGIFTTITLFMLVRIFDEFKDAKDDAEFRKNLPVPRGLVSLMELRNVGIVIAFLQLLVNIIFYPEMLLIYFVVILYLSLMGKEFFIPAWLKKHQFWYVTSHMFIIPLIDIYASGLDWLLEDVKAPIGLLFFFAVSYMNGIVLEVGRKIRNPQQEQYGVLTYSAMLGPSRATILWIGTLIITLLLSLAACIYAGHGSLAVIILLCIFVICASPALIFLANKSVRSAKAIELSSALWTIAMYLTLGGIPMLNQLLFH